MTQQNQPTLLAQAQRTDAEIAEVGYGFAYGDDCIANAATRKAFKVIIARAREIGNSDVRGFADALEAQIRSEEAHDA